MCESAESGALSTPEKVSFEPSSRLSRRGGVALVVGAVSYIAVRVAFTASRSVTSVDDTVGYQSVSFLGSAARPWVLPALFAITSDRVFVLAQTVVSASAFVLLALSIASTLRDRRVAVVVGVWIALIGLAPRVTTWDAMLITESLSISLTLMLLSVIVRRDLLSHRWVAIGAAATFVLWTFLRDAHGLLAVPVAVVVGALLIRRRQPLLAGVLLVVALLAFLSGRNNREIEAFNVSANVTYHVSYDADRLAWMLDHGMPDVAALDVGDPFARQDALNNDVVFQEWARGPGLNTYVRFLVAHPEFTLKAVPAIVLDVDFHPEGMVDHTFAEYPDPPPSVPFTLVWPREATAYSLALLVGALGVVLWAERSQRDRRLWATQALLVLTTIPHAFLVYHGAPIELARHAVVLSTVLVVSLVWIIAVGIDEAVAGQSTPRSVCRQPAAGDDQ